MGTNITRISLITTLILMGSLLSVSIALTKGPTVHAGKSNIGHLYLHQKNPETWEIVKDTYHPDQWPGKGLICLGSGTAYYNPIDGGISVHIKNKTDAESDLPAY
jgi:hypothetical protein